MIQVQLIADLGNSIGEVTHIGVQGMSTGAVVDLCDGKHGSINPTLDSDLVLD